MKKVLIITCVLIVAAAVALPIFLHSAKNEASSLSTLYAAGLHRADPGMGRELAPGQELAQDDQGRQGQPPISREGKGGVGPPEPPSVPGGPMGGPQGMPPGGPRGGPMGMPPGGPQGGHPGSDLRPPLPKLTSDQEKKTEEFLNENDPAKFNDLQELKARDEKMYGRILSEVYMDMKFLEKMKQDNPGLYRNIMEEKRLETACHGILRKMKDEKDPSKLKAYRDELKQNLYKIFDLRQSAREEKIKQIEEELQDLKKKNEMRKKNKESIVEYRLMEMIGRLHESDW